MMEKHPRWVVRLFTSDDLDSLRDLWRAVYPEQTDVLQGWPDALLVTTRCFRWS
jgi:hypothetical protein